MIKLLLKKVYESVINDSRIDFPKDGLSDLIWDKNNSTYILKEEIRNIILKAINEIKNNKEFANIIKCSRIVGSICSNQYTLESDIDVHFLIKKIPINIHIDELNNELNEYCRQNKYLDKLAIDTHPINFYFQPNEYQDLMSAGVYDIDTDKWIIGPTEVPLDFNPYDEFKDAFPMVGKYIKKIEDCLNKIKNAITLYELNNDVENIIKEIQNLKDIKKELKYYRRSFSSPTNADEAAKYREDKEWQRIDAVFKFIDKFGYLRKITIINNLIDDKKQISKNDIQKMKELI